MNDLFGDLKPNYGSTTFPEPRPFQVSAHEALRQGVRDGHRVQMLMSPTGSGKCLGRDTPVLMANGTVKMVQNITAGERLLGPDGEPRTVLSTASGREMLYRVTPKKGAPYVVNASHILSLRKTPGSDGLRLSDGTLIERDADIVNVNVEVFLNSNATARHCLKGWRADAVEFDVPEPELPLDPYWLGCWLGDGHQNIPQSYKTASVQNRLKLIAGMLDSDGSLSNKGFDWISKYEHLAEEFVFLCRSVGLSAYMAKCQKGIKSRGFVGDYWRVSVSGETDRIPCLDKVSSARLQKKRSLVHGVSIEPIGEGDYFGFEIDGDRLFLLGDFTVTHNTFLGMRVAHEALVKGRRALFICDRRTLINQTSEVADRYGLGHHGVIMADHWRVKPDMPFQIASAQTLARRAYPEVDVAIVDEAHTQMTSVIEFIQNTTAKVIGLSATPFSPGLGKIYTNLVNATTMAELTESGVLVPMRVFSCKRIDMAGAATSGGEWTDEAAGERGMAIVGDVVQEWMKFGDSRKTICFGSTIAHCEDLCRQFNEAGVMAQLFTSRTKEGEREMIIADFRKPDAVTRVLISVEALAKGFDVPDVGCVIDCRPLRKSLSTAIQMWGRGLRSSVDTVKADCILLDHSGNIERFADDYSEIFFKGLDALDAGEKLDKAIRRDDEEREPRACPSCGFKPMGMRCVSCGFEFPKAVVAVEHELGEMREIYIGKTKLADDRRHLYEQIATYTRSCGNPETANGRAWHLFRELAGTYPEGYSFERAANVPITRAVMNQIKARNIAYRAQQQKVAA